MQNEKKSIFVSILLVKILFVCLLAAPFLLPFFIGWYVSLSADLQDVYWPAMIIAYLCLVPAGIAIICMDHLLLNIRRKWFLLKRMRIIFTQYPGAPTLCACSFWSWVFGVRLRLS